MRLTEPQRRLAEANLDLAAIEAKRYVRRLGPRAITAYDTAHADALLGLCDAAARYDESLGPFRVFAVPRVRGAILDGARSVAGHGMGYGRRTARRLGPLRVTSASVELTDESTLGELIPDRSEPIGWEVESEDFVRAVGSKLPKSRREVLFARLLHARTCDPHAAAVALGVCDRLVYLHTAQALKLASEVYAELK